MVSLLSPIQLPTRSVICPFGQDRCSCPFLGLVICPCPGILAACLSISGAMVKSLLHSQVDPKTTSYLLKTSSLYVPSCSALGSNFSFVQRGKRLLSLLPSAPNSKCCVVRSRDLPQNTISSRCLTPGLAEPGTILFLGFPHCFHHILVLSTGFKIICKFCDRAHSEALETLVISLLRPGCLCRRLGNIAGSNPRSTVAVLASGDMCSPHQLWLLRDPSELFHQSGCSYWWIGFPTSGTRNKAFTCFEGFSHIAKLGLRSRWLSSSAQDLSHLDLAIIDLD